MPLRNLPSGNSPLKCVTLAHRVQVLSSTLFSFPLSFFHKRMYCILKIIICFIQPSCFRLLCFRKSFFFFFSLFGFCSLPFLQSFKLCWNSPCKLWHLHLCADDWAKGKIWLLEYWSHCGWFGTRTTSSQATNPEGDKSLKSPLSYLSTVYLCQVLQRMGIEPLDYVRLSEAESHPGRTVRIDFNLMFMS